MTLLRLSLCLICMSFGLCAASTCQAQAPASTLPRPSFNVGVTGPVATYGRYTYGRYLYGGHASTVGESYARGAADVIRARGQAALLKAEALRSFEEARSRDLDNDAKQLEIRQERRRMGLAQREASREKLRARRSTFLALNDNSQNVTSAEKAEKRAASKVRLAKSLLRNGRTHSGVKWLVDVLEDYPQTEAATEAYVVLKQMSGPQTATAQR